MKMNVNQIRQALLQQGIRTSNNRIAEVARSLGLSQGIAVNYSEFDAKEIIERVKQQSKSDTSSELPEQPVQHQLEKEQPNQPEAVKHPLEQPNKPSQEEINAALAERTQANKSQIKSALDASNAALAGQAKGFLDRMHQHDRSLAREVATHIAARPHNFMAYLGEELAALLPTEAQTFVDAEDLTADFAVPEFQFPAITSASVLGALPM